MKKVLLIAYFLPPSGAVGVYRTLKFMKYLPEFGWTPIALTTSNGKFPKYDESLMSMIPEGVDVHRCPSMEWLNEGENKRNAGKEKPKRKTLWSRIHTRLYLLCDALLVPDTKAWWIPNAVAKAVSIIRTEKIDHVYVSASPFSSFLIGVMAKKLTGAKLLIDYRDPWTQNIDYTVRNRFRTWMEKRMEAMVIRNSDVVISNTRFNDISMYEEFGGDHRREQFVPIHNGFDPDDFAAVTPADNKGKFTITYAGAFYYSIGSDFSKGASDDVMRTYSPLYFFEALEQLFARRPEIKSNFKVNFMGVLGHGFDPIIQERGLADVVERLGYIDYDEHLQVLKGSDTLLLVLSRSARSRGWIPSKFYQYLATGKPVLGLVPEGEVRQIIHDANAGICVEPDDVDAASAAIESLYDDFAAGNVAKDRNQSEVSKYERRHLTRLLSQALESA